jgi:ribosomal protein L22
MMSYTVPITKDMVSARTTAAVSLRASIVVCRELNRMHFDEAKKLIEAIVEKRESIDGKYHTVTSEAINKLLESLESNAKARNIEPSKMTLLISAHKGANMMRTRTKRMYGYHMKSTHLHAILKPKAEKKVEKK